MARPSSPATPTSSTPRIEKIEFLGSYCLVRVASPALGTTKLTVYLSLNFLAEQRSGTASRLPLQAAARAHAPVRRMSARFR